MMILNILKRLKRMYNKQAIITLIVLLIVLGLAAFTSIRIQLAHIDRYITQFESNIVRLLDTSISNKNKIVKIIVNDYFKDDTLEKLYEIKYASDEDKDRLKNAHRHWMLRKYSNLYVLLSRIGVRQFQIHLPDTESFLRLHKPHIYGDKLESIRGTVNKVINDQQVAISFEEGRFSNGYRYVYPLIYKEELVGTVEFSFSTKSIMQPINDIYDIESLAIISKDYIDERSFLDVKNVYGEDTYINWGYVDPDYKHNKIVSKLGINQEIIDKLGKKIRSQIDASVDEYHSVYTITDNKLIMGYTIPIFDINKNVVGYYIVYKNDRVLYNLIYNKRVSSIVITTLSLFLILFIIVLIYMWNNYKYLASHDGLTNLYNRRYSSEVFRKSNLSGVVFMIDLDNFKMINDQHGHMVGDKILIGVAKLFLSNIRSTDYAVRWGGEEFMILLKSIDIDNGRIKAEQLCELIRNHDFNGVDVTISIGACPVTVQIEEAINCADKALYRAKTSGKDKVVVFNSSPSNV